jgi:hypothetical protein
MTILDLLKIVPWRWKLWILFVTSILLLIILPYSILCAVNPFWCRSSMFKSCERLIDWAEMIRLKAFLPIIKKYTLFETIKNAENSD